MENFTPDQLTAIKAVADSNGLAFEDVKKASYVKGSSLIINTTALYSEFSPEQIEHIRAFALASGLTVEEVIEAARNLKRVGIVEVEESAHVVDERYFKVAYQSKEPVKVENRDRIPVPSRYKRNRFQR